MPSPLNQTSVETSSKKQPKKLTSSTQNKIDKTITKKPKTSKKRLQTSKVKPLKNNVNGRTVPKLLNPASSVFKASELDKNPLWQSCKLKIKIPLQKMDTPFFPSTSSQKYGFLALLTI